MKTLLSFKSNFKQNHFLYSSILQDAVIIKPLLFSAMKYQSKVFRMELIKVHKNKKMSLHSETINTRK